MTTQQIQEKLNSILVDLTKLQEETWVQEWSWQQFHLLYAAVENLSDLDDSLKESESEAA